MLLDDQRCGRWGSHCRYDRTRWRANRCVPRREGSTWCGEGLDRMRTFAADGSSSQPRARPGARRERNHAGSQLSCQPTPTVTLRVGERSGLLATAFDRIGNVIPPSASSGRPTTSTSRRSTTTAPSPGSQRCAIVEARVGARRGQAAVQVTGGATAPPPPPAAPAAPPRHRARSVAGNRAWEWTGCRRCGSSPGSSICSRPRTGVFPRGRYGRTALQRRPSMSSGHRCARTWRASIKAGTS